MLSTAVVGGYVVGLGVLVLMVLPLWWAAARLRARLFPDWGGALGRLVDVLITLSGLLVVSLAAGAVGLFRDWAVTAGCLAVGIPVGRWAGKPPRRVPDAVEAGEVAHGRLSAAVASGWVAAAAVLWVYRTSYVFPGGIGEWDSVWYHLPFAARFVQLGSLTHIHDVGNPAGSFYPADLSVLHALGMLAFGHDLLSPLSNLAALALVLLAAWCVGLPSQRQHATVTLGALVSAWPIMQFSQPGTANADMFGLGLVLAVVALSVNGAGRTSAVVLAGATLGMVAGTKLSLVPMAVVLAPVVLLMAPAGRRAASWGGAAAAAFATGGLWYVRNAVRAGNPLPWVGVELGPLRLPEIPFEPVDCGTTTVLELAGSSEVWREWFVPGLSWAFGPLVPGLIALAVGVAGWALLRAQGRTLRALAAAALVGIAAYTATPASGGGLGVPHCFSYNLRFLVPALTVGLVVAVVALPRRWDRGVLAGTSLGFAATLATAARVGAPLLLAAVLLAAAVWRWRGGPPVALREGDRRGVVAAAGAALAVVAFGGAVLTSWYLDHRYADMELLGSAEVTRWVHDVEGARIAVVGFARHYQFYGRTGTENVVEFVQDPTSPAVFARPGSCDRWRSALWAGGYDYVAAGTSDAEWGLPQELGWTRGDERAEEIARGDLGSVFFLDPEVPPSPCR